MLATCSGVPRMINVNFPAPAYRFVSEQDVFPNPNVESPGRFSPSAIEVLPRHPRLRKPRQETESDPARNPKERRTEQQPPDANSKCPRFVPVLHPDSGIAIVDEVLPGVIIRRNNPKLLYVEFCLPQFGHDLFGVHTRHERRDNRTAVVNLNSRSLIITWLAFFQNPVRHFVPAGSGHNEIHIVDNITSARTSGYAQGQVCSVL